MKNLLLPVERVKTGEYFHRYREGFRLAGFILVQPYTAPPPHDTWSKPAYNRFTAIAHEAVVDGRPAFIVPVFFNDRDLDVLFDGDVEKPKKKAIAYFKGNDDWNYAMRFDSYRERDEMIQLFGEDLGFLEQELIGHN